MNTGAYTLGEVRAGAVSIGMPAQVNQEGHIPQMFAEIDRALNVLMDEIGGLESRVNPALRSSVPQPPSVNQGSAPPAPVVSQVAAVLAGYAERINIAAYRVRDMAARADL